MYFLSHISIHAFLTFPYKFYLYKKFKLSIKDYLLLIYTFMCMIIFLMIIILSFQSHQTRILSAGLGMSWNRYGLSCIVNENVSCSMEQECCAVIISSVLPVGACWCCLEPGCYVSSEASILPAGVKCWRASLNHSRGAGYPDLSDRTI